MPEQKKTRPDTAAAEAVDRQLARYRAIRDFAITAEPRGGSKQYRKAEDVLPFVVQKHAARQLHYDFRLGWNGVLKSWAVAKGPSYTMGDKRLAVEVEDHPMEYGGFEGTIPKGQYGGGTVMVWDFGEWEPLGDVDKQLADGNLKFTLKGTKLRGKWALVRMKRNPERDRGDKPNWLLLKERDEFAQPTGAEEIIDLAPDSALTERTMEEIAASSDHVWDSKIGLRAPDKTPKKSAGAAAEKATVRSSKALERLLRGVPIEDFPGFIAPQLADEARSASSGKGWVHELKLDGYRTQVHVRLNADGRTVRARVFTRKGLDWTARMPAIARAAEGLGVESAILDGEVVVLDENGRTSFSDLQAAFQNGTPAELVYFVFDLLHLNGHNLRGLPLLKRKQILEELLAQAGSGSTLRFCEHIEADGDLVFRKACELGAEGIVSKLGSAPYTSGRGSTWIKRKGSLKQEFVIGGFTPVARTGRGIGALLLGVYDGGRLIYAGRTGTGFSQETERMLRTRLDALVQKMPAFAEIPREARENATWVKPELVAQVAFAAWTKDNLIRQSSFKSLREDKPASEVVREACAADEAVAAAAPAVKRMELGISRPGKILDDASGMTKQQLAEYYVAVAEHMLPHVGDRPLSVVRCPDGIGKQHFFQKRIAAGLPAGVHLVPIANRKTGKREEFLTINSVEGLVGMAQLGVLEIHPWGSRNETPDRPDRIIFDLDPDEAVAWSTLAGAALELRSRLEQLKLKTYVKSTGGKGLHVVVPIGPELDWPTIKQFSYAVVVKMEKENPRLYTTNMSKAVRKGRIYLDYLRNDMESTAIGAFSTRARPGVPVAVPLEWEELDGAARPVFHVTDFDEWKKRLKRDPWQQMMKERQRLTVEMLASVGLKGGS